ncbi:MAG: hypothetical protein IKE69_13340 [Thermoguttaceae bacterium]|nr:hypothetical protein [Thermoguttaceae bacterium]
MKKSLPVIVIATIFLVLPLRAATPLEDAVALWHFADTANSAQSHSWVTIEGDVRLGVPLSENEGQQSRLRGGDGFVADFSRGGWLSAEVAPDFDIKGRQLTIYLRLRDPSGVWNVPIISRFSKDNRPQYRVYATDSMFSAQAIATENWRLLSVNASFSEMTFDRGRDRWHDIVLRIDGTKLNLFVNGRLYDEDFILGDLIDGFGPIRIGAEPDENGKITDRFQGQIDTFALWDRPLSYEEILFISGGPCLADMRQLTDLGDGASLQYWIPPNNYSVGDCMPFYADGTFHFMYLLDKGHHSSKNSLGGHQWIQATSKDLIHWTHQPFLFEMENQEEGSFCTGSVFYHEGVYYAYYSDRAFEYPGGDYTAQWIMHGQLAMAISKDGIHFEKTHVEPLIHLPEEYAHTTRDPVVFQNPITKKFHMYFTTSYQDYGCWGHAVSDDLYHWELTDPIYSKRKEEPECPDWFEWGGKYYVIANFRNGFWLWSDTPTGPWDIPPVPNELMPGMINVPKTAPYKDGRRIICGWTREYGFGGHSVFHELIRHDDGTLGEKFVPEMIPPTDPPIISQKDFQPAETRQWDVPISDMQIRISLSYPPERRDLIQDLTFQFSDNAVLVVSPRMRSVSLGQFSLYKIDFTSGKIDLLMILKGNIADLEINNDKTLTATFDRTTERKLSVSGEGNENGWRINLFEVSPLKQ